MKIDFYTKTILTVIAICLMILTLRTVQLVPEAIAQGSFSCTGDLKANAYGGVASLIGGYRVDIRCS